jgi:hypothetical protein
MIPTENKGKKVTNNIFPSPKSGFLKKSSALPITMTSGTDNDSATPPHTDILFTIHPFIRSTIEDRILGTIFGAAVGDAVGLYTGMFYSFLHIYLYYH